MKSHLVRYWFPLTLLLFVGITAVSLFPLPQLPEVPGKDKTLHLIAYGLLAFPVSFAKPKNYWLILLLFITWSGLIELVQPNVNRYSEWLDFLANCLGVVLGFLVARGTSIIWR